MAQEVGQGPVATRRGPGQVAGGDRVDQFDAPAHRTPVPVADLIKRHSPTIANGGPLDRHIDSTLMYATHGSAPTDAGLATDFPGSGAEASFDHANEGRP